MNSKVSFLTDLIIFQLAWFGCVLATTTPYPYMLPTIGTLLVIIRTVFTKRLKLALPGTLACFVLGILGDGILVHLELVSFDPYPNFLGAPFWMVALWINFGLMLNPLFTWFLENFYRSLLGFSLGGLVAYYSGEKLSVLTFCIDFKSHIGVALEWAVAGIVLNYIQNKFFLPRTVK